MHERNNKRITVIIAIIAIIAVLTIIAISIGLSIYDSIMSDRYHSEKAALGFEKNQLLLQRERVQEEIYSQLGPHAFLTLMLNNLDESFVDAFCEELSKCKIDKEAGGPLTATLLLAPDELPGMEGNISLEEFNSYINRGYSYALSYDGTTELGEYLENMSELLFELGITFPGTICYYGSDGDILLKDKDKPILESYGITVAASMRGNGVMLEREMYDGIFSPGILGWNTINVSSNTFAYALNKGGNFGFVFDNESSNTSIYKQSSFMNFDSSQYRSAFRRMLERYKSAINNGKLVITDYETATYMRREFLADYEEIKPTLIAALDAIDAQIAEIDKQLSQISDKYKR